MPQKPQTTVSDCMTRDVNTISKTATLAEAVNMMIAKKTNGLVVTNGGYKIVGIL